MSDTSSSAAPPAPVVDPNAIKEIATGVFVICDHRVPLVPNIGIILGSHTALVVDTGMGPANGKKVLEAAKRIAGQRPLVLTLTHFHPEHGFGAQVFQRRGEDSLQPVATGRTEGEGRRLYRHVQDLRPAYRRGA